MTAAVGGFYGQCSPTFEVDAALGQHIRVALNSDFELVADGATGNDHVGWTNRKSLAANEEVSVSIRGDGVVKKMIAGGAISARAVVYKAASGKVASSGTVPLGIALMASSADDDVIEVLEAEAVTPAAVVAAVSTADASDAASAVTLANALKTTVNAILTAIKAKGLMASS